MRARDNARPCARARRRRWRRRQLERMPGAFDPTSTSGTGTGVFDPSLPARGTRADHMKAVCVSALE
jgi:hypothetical protein